MNARDIERAGKRAGTFALSSHHHDGPNPMPNVNGAGDRYG
jgi:hypothetical protein